MSVKTTQKETQCVEHCRKCEYVGVADGIMACNYAAITGICRMAEIPACADRVRLAAAENCRHFADHTKDAARPGARKLDTKEQLRIALYHKGLNDPQIAAIVGCGPQAIQSWRRSRRLAANCRQGGQCREVSCGVE